jgi:hypothetical protein
MRITLTRGSVSMGDDADAPHFADLETAADAALSAVLRAVDATGYHHVHAGGWTTWAVYLGFASRTDSSRSLAVLNHHHVAYLEDPNARLKDLAGGGAADLYFEYVLRNDPGTVRDRLLGGRDTSAAADFGPARD